MKILNIKNTVEELDNLNNKMDNNACDFTVAIGESIKLKDNSSKFIFRLIFKIKYQKLVI